MAFNTQPILDKLNAFKELKAGWNYGVGDPISKNALKSAAKITTCFSHNYANSVDAFPCENGAILVSGYYDNHYYVDVFCQANQTFDFTLEKENSILKDEENLSFIEITLKLKNPTWLNLKRSDSLIVNDITTRLKSASHQRLSKTPAVAVSP